MKKNLSGLSVKELMSQHRGLFKEYQDAKKKLNPIKNRGL